MKVLITGCVFIFLIFYPACKSRDLPANVVNDNSGSNTAVANNNANEQNSQNKNSEDIRILSSPETVTAALTRNRSNKIEAVSPGEVFFKGDGVRVNISTAEEGLLYIFYKGSSGGAEILFPKKNYNGGKNEVKANEVITVPREGWFFFDEKPGVETIYVIYSKTKDDLIGKDESGAEYTLKNKPEEIIKYLDDAQARSGADAFATFNGNLVRRILLNHK